MGDKVFWVTSVYKYTILNEPTTNDDEEKNAEAAELIQFPDDKSLSLCSAADDGHSALKILRGYYACKGKHRIINLYTKLTLKLPTESVTEYVIRAEIAITALRNAEVPSDGNGFERAARDFLTVCYTWLRVMIKKN